MTVTSPSPRQSGHANFPHPAFARCSRAKHSQVNQPVLLSQANVDAHSFRGTPGPLASSAQMAVQPQVHIVVDPHENAACSITTPPVVVGPSAQVRVEFIHQKRKRLCVVPRPGHLPQSLSLSQDRFPGRAHLPFAVFRISNPLHLKAVAEEVELRASQGCPSPVLALDRPATPPPAARPANVPAKPNTDSASSAASHARRRLGGSAWPPATLLYRRRQLSRTVA